MQARKRRDAMADRPEAANGMIKAVRQLFRFAVGRSEHDIMAVTGHKTSKEVVRHTRAASQKLRAERAMDGFEYGQDKNKSVPQSK